MPPVFLTHWLFWWLCLTEHLISPCYTPFSDCFSSWVTFFPPYSGHHIWSVQSPYGDLSRLWDLKGHSVFTCNDPFPHYTWASCPMTVPLPCQYQHFENLHWKHPTLNTISCPAASPPLMFPLKLLSDPWTYHFDCKYCLLSLKKRYLLRPTLSYLSALFHSLLSGKSFRLSFF